MGSWSKAGGPCGAASLLSGGYNAEPVVNVHGPEVVGFPTRSRTERAIVYVRLACSVTDGFSVAVLVAALYVTVAGMTLDPSLRTTVPVVGVAIGSLNRTVTFAFRRTPTARFAGEAAATVGAGPVVNCQPDGTSAFPAVSRMDENAILYVRSARSVALGFTVTVLVVLLYVTAAGIGVALPLSRSTTVPALTFATGSLNVAVMFAVWLAERAPTAGVLAVIVGATNSVRGVVSALRADAAPVPAELIAATSNV